LVTDNGGGTQAEDDPGMQMEDNIKRSSWSGMWGHGVYWSDL